MLRLFLLLALLSLSGACGSDDDGTGPASIGRDADDGTEQDAGSSCLPQCDNRACGADGCGGSCGACDPGFRCEGSACVELVPPCENGVQDLGEEGVDCGGRCPACPPVPCTASDSDYVPAEYTCVWNEEFGGAFGDGQPRTLIDSRYWTFQNLNVNGEAQNYTNRECADPDHESNWNYCVENGALTLFARDQPIDCSDGPDEDNQPDNPDCALDWGEARERSQYTSGRLITKHKVAYQYGYIEFRARLPQWNRDPQSGLWPAIWLLGSNIVEGPPPGSVSWPFCGEFDILEWKSPGNVMGWNALWVGPDQNLDACSDFPEGGAPACGPCIGGSCRGVRANGQKWIWDGWPDFPHAVFHTYGFLWTRETMDVFIDGDKVSTFRLGPSESEFQQDMFLIVNLALGGSLGGPIEITDWSTTSLEVDYLRWYQSK